MTDTATRLLCALAMKAGRRPVASADSVGWQSVTFTGERHMIELRFTGQGSADDVDRLITGLDEHEFAIPGVLVADIVWRPPIHEGADRVVSLEILTIDVSLEI